MRDEDEALFALQVVADQATGGQVRDGWSARRSAKSCFHGVNMTASMTLVCSPPGQCVEGAFENVRGNFEQAEFAFKLPRAEGPG